MNFSLNYRHLVENNPENYKMLMCINMKVADRRGIRLMIFEKDNIRELGSRLMHYLWTNQALYLPHEYSEFMLQSLVFYIETQLTDFGLSTSPIFTNSLESKQFCSNPNNYPQVYGATLPAWQQ